MQFTVIAASLLASAGFAVATPPACLINAIGVQGSDATDMEMLCDAKQELVLGNLTASCADDMVEPAYEAYSSTCLAEASVTVASLPEQTDANATSSADASDVTGSSNSSSGSGNSSDSSSSSGGGSGNGTGSGAGGDDEDSLDDASAASAAALPGMVALIGTIAGAVALL